MKRRKFNESQLAVEFGLDRRTLANRLEGVEPCEVRPTKSGREMREYWLRDAAPAILGVDVSAKQKLELLKVRDLELDIAERQGDLVRLSDQQRMNDALAIELGAVFDGLPHSVAHECAGKSAEEIVGILKQALDSARAVVAQIRVQVPQLSDTGTRQGLNGHAVG